MVHRFSVGLMFGLLDGKLCVLLSFLQMLVSLSTTTTSALLQPPPVRHQLAGFPGQLKLGPASTRTPLYYNHAPSCAVHCNLIAFCAMLLAQAPVTSCLPAAGWNCWVALVWLPKHMHTKSKPDHILPCIVLYAYAPAISCLPAAGWTYWTALIWLP
eukprot:1160973-Pelagomonas_calceolata.AAC.6